MVGGVLFVFYYFHFFIMLLGLELMMLSVYLGFSSVWGRFGDIMISFFFLVVVVCIGGFGLSLLVFFSRGWGSGLVLFF